jgi:hypothetical protein
MRFSSRWNTKEFLYWSGIAACTALAYAYAVTVVQPLLRLTRQAWQQIKQHPTGVQHFMWQTSCHNALC